MNLSLRLGLLAVPLAIAGCSSPGKASLFGTGVGTIIGAGAGFAAGSGRDHRYRARNIIIGGALGGVLGGGLGYVTSDSKEKKEESHHEKEQQGDQKIKSGGELGGGAPVLVPPRVVSRFIDDQVRGNTFIPAHVEYQIVEQAKWNR